MGDSYTCQARWHTCAHSSLCFDFKAVLWHYTLIKFWQYNKVNLAPSAFPATAFCPTLAKTKVNVKFPESNPVSACRGFPTELTSVGYPCCILEFSESACIIVNKLECSATPLPKHHLLRNQNHGCGTVPDRGYGDTSKVSYITHRISETHCLLMDDEQ